MCILCSIIAFWLIYPLFWLWTNVREWKPLCKHVGKITMKFKVYSQSQCICIDICTDLSLLIGLIFITKTKSPYIVRKTSLVSKIPIAGRMNSKGFLDSIYIATIRLNHPIKFCKNIYLDLIQVKPLDRSVVGLNQLLKLLWFSDIAIIVYRHWLFL